MLQIRLLVLGICIFILIPAGVYAVTNTTYSVLLSPDNETYMEVIHIVIRGGTDEEIGYELGRIGIIECDSVLVPFDSSIYGKAKEEYIRGYDSVLENRVKGIKQAYDLKEDDYTFDATFPVYVTRFPSCSAIYFPPVFTQDGHAIAGRNMEWSYNPNLDVFTEIQDGNLQEILIDRMGTLNHVVEIYPEEGYATLVIGTTDLLNGVVDGINEEGLYVASLQDGDTYNDPLSSLAGGTTTGLNFMQTLRSVLEHCATVKEAKMRLLTSRISMPFIGQHFLICDDSGEATIAEFDNTSREVIFTDYNDTPVSLTNYAVHLKPDITKLAPENPQDTHDDYLRSAKLHQYINNHKGLFNTSDAWDAMAEVQANADASSEGGLTGETVRLLWTVVTDLTEKTMTVQFFLRDGPISNEQYKTHDLILSEPFTFTLK